MVEGKCDTQQQYLRAYIHFVTVYFTYTHADERPLLTVPHFDSLTEIAPTNSSLSSMIEQQRKITRKSASVVFTAKPKSNCKFEKHVVKYYPKNLLTINSGTSIKFNSC